MTKFKEGDRVVLLVVEDWQKVFSDELEVGQAFEINKADSHSLGIRVKRGYNVFFSPRQVELEFVYNSPLYKALS